MSGCRLRILAESKGYRLDDTGLFLATQGSGGKRVISWFGLSLYLNPLLPWFICGQHTSILLQGSRATTSLGFRTEQEVFEFLGFPWLEPHERNLWKWIPKVYIPYINLLRSGAEDFLSWHTRELTLEERLGSSKWIEKKSLAGVALHISWWQRSFWEVMNIMNFVNKFWICVCSPQ